MHPNLVKSDLPSSHDVLTFIHNAFSDLLRDLKTVIQVSFFFSLFVSLYICFFLQSKQAGRISTTTDLWSVSQTKASFMGLTAHWIESDTQTSTWTLRKEVIAFRAVSGPHDGINLGRYFIGLCERVGIIDGYSTKVQFFLYIILCSF